jgi:phosphopentomutase
LPAQRVILIILDGVGVGELPDAARYNDEGSNTIVNTAHAVNGLRLPHLEAWGLGNIVSAPGLNPVPHPRAHFGRMAERSKGKDSTTGHWELTGLLMEEEFPLFPGGFPESLLKHFLRATACDGYLGNIPASGTVIMEDLGSEHMRTGWPIVYTSGDSVFQIAAHEEIIPLERLYDICQKTRDEVCIGPFAVARVIARPFIGNPGAFTRTQHRKDYSLVPPSATLLDLLQKANVTTFGVGKVDDLFANRGLSVSNHTRSNAAGVEAIIAGIHQLRRGMIIANLGDFDSLYGHRNDPVGFARALEEFDRALPEIEEPLEPSDLLIVTADHGNDPVTPSTDHSREYVPLLCFMKQGHPGRHLGTRETFADVAKTIAEFFGVENTLPGKSFLSAVANGDGNDGAGNV